MTAPLNAQDLSTFGVLAGSTVTNTGPTVINGNVGLSPGTSVTGFFPPGIVTPPYTIHNSDAVAAQAQSDLTTAYNILAGRPSTADLTGQDLGTVGTLTAGVYNFNSSAQLTGTLTLDGQGNSDSVFIFNIDSTLTTASSSSIVLINDADPNKVFFRVGSSAMLGTSTDFQGKILALTSISLNDGATIDCGAALARNGAVTLINNVINICMMEAVVIGDGLDDTATENAEAVADAIDDYVDSGGILPLGFAVLDLLTPAELDEALSQIAGEAATGVAPTANQAMNSFLDSVINQGFGDESAPGQETGPGRGTVTALGYAPETPRGADLAFGAYEGASSATFDPRLWGLWSAVYGGTNDVDGNAAAGTHDRSSDNYGIAIGLDYRVTPDSKVGVAISGGATSFSLSDGYGSGSSNMLQAAIYSRTNFEAAYIAAALAYAYHDQTTDRTITVAGEDHFRANFDAHNIAGHLEAGYRMGWFTPYGAVRVQAFYTPDYSEETISGASTFALDYDEQTTTSTRTELGTRFNHTIGLDDGAWLALRGRVAWAHEFSDQPSMTAGFQALPGSSFTVKGAAANRDSVLLSAGAEIGFASGFSLAGWIDSQLADGSQTYAGNGRVRYAW